ncbi:MAG: hypothetical protein Q4D02_05620 [Clostridia bacterium]|nr:hypothetical protein [Clostridia bacterium]
MKILKEAKGYIEREYATYSKNAVGSYLGDGKSHLYLNFALEDEMIKKILSEYAIANSQRRTELIYLYHERVNQLIQNNEFDVKNLHKQTGIPSVEIDDKSPSGYLIGTFCNEIQKFIDMGSIVYIPNKYYSFIKVIQHVEIGYGDQKRIAGFFYIPYELDGFKFYIVTRKKDSDGNYYVEEVSIDYSNSCCKFSKMLLNDQEFQEMKSDLTKF